MQNCELCGKERCVLTYAYAGWSHLCWLCRERLVQAVEREIQKIQGVWAGKAGG